MSIYPQGPRQIPGLTLIHISGSPGSGKSFIGQELAKKWKDVSLPLVRVVETDDFIQTNTDEGRELHGLELAGVSDKDYASAWQKIVERKIDDAVRDATDSGVRVLIFVGLLSNFSHNSSRIYPLHMRYYIAQNWRFFLYPDPAIAWKQFIDRYWKEPESERGLLPLKKDYMKSNSIERDWHQFAGYRLVANWSDIFDEINSFIESLRPAELPAGTAINDSPFHPLNIKQFAFANMGQVAVVSDITAVGISVVSVPSFRSYFASAESVPYVLLVIQGDGTIQEITKPLLTAAPMREVSGPTRSLFRDYMIQIPANTTYLLHAGEGGLYCLQINKPPVYDISSPPEPPMETSAGMADGCHKPKPAAPKERSCVMCQTQTLHWIKGPAGAVYLCTDSCMTRYKELEKEYAVWFSGALSKPKS